MHYFLLVMVVLFLLVLFPLQYTAPFVASFVVTPLLVSIASSALIKVPLSFWDIIKGMILSVVFVLLAVLVAAGMFGGIQASGVMAVIFMLLMFVAFVLGYKVALGLNFMASAIIAILSTVINAVVLTMAKAMFGTG
jgi:hypothetical protein